MLDDNRSETVIEELRRRALGARAGERLPSVRELCRRHRASPLTVQRAISRLTAEGLVEARPGKGTFAAASRTPVEGGLDWQLVAVPQGGASDPLLRLLSPPSPGTVPLAV